MTTAPRTRVAQISGVRPLPGVTTACATDRKQTWTAVVSVRVVTWARAATPPMTVQVSTASRLNVSPPPAKTASKTAKKPMLIAVDRPARSAKQALIVEFPVTARAASVVLGGQAWCASHRVAVMASETATKPTSTAAVPAMAAEWMDSAMATQTAKRRPVMRKRGVALLPPHALTVC